MTDAKILIVEDEESIRLPLEDNLKLEGYQVSSAKDGVDGLSMAQKENFDLIVVGNRGLGGTAALLLGSVSRQVVTGAVCNVLVVKK